MKNARRHHPGLTAEAVEVRRQGDGIDEIVARNCSLHIERMSDHGWFVGVEGSDGSYWQFWLGAKNGRSHVEARHTETTPYDPTENARRGYDLWLACAREKRVRAGLAEPQNDTERR